MNNYINLFEHPGTITRQRKTAPAWIIFFLLFVSCATGEKKATVKAFYYWKSYLELSSPEKNAISTLGIRKMYIKFFDVVWNEGSHSPFPVAKLTIDESIPAYLSNESIEIIPTVFITNECLSRVDSDKIPDLASQVNNLVNSMLRTNGFISNKIRELQFDCDWTASTSDNYFTFLNSIKKLRASQKTRLSATIRLYQCKYLKRTGVPPVDRGLLMCYNMGNLRDPSHKKNSILDLNDLEQYTAGLENYPLPLDLAFPLFDWKVLFRANTYAGLVQRLPQHQLEDSRVSVREDNVFRLLRDTIIGGYSFRKGDLLRDEQSNPGDIISAGKILSRKLKNKEITISLYHLDSATIGKYTMHELENIFSSVH
ncbi:hypothetical protein [Flavitalea sp.]|nr:hypothetical protein [Flavitalea sp.]